MINVFAYYFGIGGWANFSRGLISALSRFEDIALVSWVPPLADEVSPAVEKMLENARCLSKDDVSIAIGPPEKTAESIGRWKAAYTVWETTRVPVDKLRCLDNADEIWIPSRWGKKILIENGVGKDRISVVPGGVDPDLFKPSRRPRARATDRPYKFLSVAKWEERKGLGDLVESFCEEFHADENVELVLHCFNPYNPGVDPAVEVKRLSSATRLVTVIARPLTPLEILALFDGSDAFVLPTRGEGWGLAIMEAMACALPVIVTDYSAHRDFVNSDNAFLIRVERMKDVYDPVYFPAIGSYGQWAQPDLDHLKLLMRYVFENPEAASRKGLIARRNVERFWTWERAAEIALARLAELGKLPAHGRAGRSSIGIRS